MQVRNQHLHRAWSTQTNVTANTAANFHRKAIANYSFKNKESYSSAV